MWGVFCHGLHQWVRSNDSMVFPDEWFTCSTPVFYRFSLSFSYGNVRRYLSFDVGFPLESDQATPIHQVSLFLWSSLKEISLSLLHNWMLVLSPLCLCSSKLELGIYFLELCGLGFLLVLFTRKVWIPIKQKYGKYFTNTKR